MKQLKVKDLWPPCLPTLPRPIGSEALVIQQLFDSFLLHQGAAEMSALPSMLAHSYSWTLPLLAPPAHPPSPAHMQLEPLGITITCKERSKRIVCPLVMLQPAAAGGSSGGCGAFALPSSGAAASASAVEPFTAYLKEGDWWLEFSRLLTAGEAAAAAGGGGRSASGVLPPDLAPEHELLRALQREHCRLADVCGEVAVLRTKKLPARLAPAAAAAAAGGPLLYQRYVWDMETRHVLTDAPASDFVLD